MKKLMVIALTLVLIPALFAKESAPKSIKSLSEPLVPIPQFRSGGPDSFGYEWLDSDEPFGPVFNWIEISGTGTDMLLTDDDHYWGIPFSFTFYGTTYDSIAVGSNGTVYFKDHYLGLGNGPIPGYSGYDVDTFIAVYWNDLNPEEVGAGAVYYQIMGDTLVVEWDDIPLYDYPDSIETFEALLIGSTGEIILQYLVAMAQGFEATIGIQGSPVQPPLWGLEYSYMTPSLHDSLAIKFYIPFHDVGPISIDIPTPIPEGSILTPMATVRNFGNKPETYDVWCEIDPGGYSSSVTDANLFPGDSIQISFSPDFTFVSGNYTVTVYTDLIGDDDPANDTLVKIIETYVPSVAEENFTIPKKLALNIQTISVNGRTNVEFALPKAADVKLEVYDALGRPLKTIVSDRFSAGTHSMAVNLDLPAGVYFYNLKTDIGENIVKKVLHVR